MYSCLRRPENVLIYWLASMEEVGGPVLGLPKAHCAAPRDEVSL